MDILRKLQLAELYMMKKVAQICEENDIRYYLCGGSLLGAIRHGGFIPWDDDLDITMYREDLSRLCEIISRDYSDVFFVQNFETDKHYTRYITKIRLNGTKQAEEGYDKDDIHQGIYIDIFPLDHVTKRDGAGLKFRGRLLRFLFAYKTARCTKDKSATRGKKILIKILKPFTYLIPQSFINRLFHWTCTATDKPDAKYTTSFASHYKWKRQLVDNEVYGEGILHKFENEEFRIPAQYEKLLLQIFGDKFMELPPADKRNSGHTLVDIDLGRYETVVLEMANESGETIVDG